MTTQELIEKINRVIPQNNAVDITYSINEILLDIVNTLEGNGVDSGSEPLIYIAKLIQSGTAAPVATVIVNTIGAIVWSRSGSGSYLGTLTGAFTLNKTSVLIGNQLADDGGVLQWITAQPSANTNTISVSSKIDGAGSSDSVIGGIVQNQIRIEVYP